ncbi:alcohol oxidase [Leucogyrophana mollusca]|uniref:Alcohol oxidase n=1 Tax=Leucogyrophana mollusca TaxID=85980 RepID=A0ACB8BUQ4_9AGAM|nr:alcohol oxidase [Leucogyrophana mollusca]
MSFADITRVAGQSFDFIIIGGGTSGLCVAARLSENPKVSVVVLEAGQANLADPLIMTPGGFLGQIGNPHYDWMRKTVPQKTNGGAEYIINSGKGLGGSSRMNFLSWNKPVREDMDAWEKLGNPGWNWDSFVDYSKKSEQYIPKRGYDVTTKNEQELYGECGPLKVSFPAEIWEGSAYVLKVLEALGIPILDYPVPGEAHGAGISLSTIDPATQSRSYAVTDYLLPNADRPNLVVLTGARAQKIIVAADQNLLSASGVRFTHNNSIYEVYATLEVILCAGALSSPSLLELSGIGDRSILEPLGIDVKLHLPGVGRNLQEHITHMGACFELKQDTDILTYDLTRDPAYVGKHGQTHQQRYRDPLALALPSTLAFLPVQKFSARADIITDHQVEKLKRSSAAAMTVDLVEQYEIQLDFLRNPRIPECEIITFPGFFGYGKFAPAEGKRYFTLMPTLLHPWSRGTVHVNSEDPDAHPCIDPHYLEEELDLELMVDIVKYVRSLGQMTPLKEIIAVEAVPGPTVVSDDDVRSYIKSGIKSTWHTMGTLSMLPLDRNGVVDHQLRVYGTTNIRVADLSIAPMQVSSHTQSVVYAIAERAADIIRADHPQ